MPYANKKRKGPSMSMSQSGSAVRNYRPRSAYRARSVPRPIANYDSHLHKLRLIGDIAWNNAGTIKQWISDDPSQYLDWASLAALYDLYRMYSIKVEYFPLHPNDASSDTKDVQGQPPLVLVYDPDSTTFPSGYPSTETNALLEYSTSKVMPSNQPWSLYFRVPKVMQAAGATVRENGFIDVANPVAASALLIAGNYFTGGLGTTNYLGKLVVSAMVQFSKRR